MREEFTTKSRIIFGRYLPGAIFRLRERGAYVKSEYTSPDPSATIRIAPEQLYDVVQRAVSDWTTDTQGAIDAGLFDALDTRDHRRLEIRFPNKIVVSPFPLMLVCNGCKRIVNTSGYRKAEEVKAGMVRGLKGKRLHCSYCGGVLRQFPFAKAHRCGSLEAIEIPHNLRSVASNGDLSFQEGAGIRDSKFKNAKTNEDYGQPLQFGCKSCQRQFPNLDDGTVAKGVRSGSDESFIVQSLQYIAIDDDAARLVRRICDFSRGTFDQTLRRIAETVISGLSGRTDRKTAMDSVESLVSGSSAAQETSLADALARRDLAQKVYDDAASNLEATGMAEETIASILGDLRAKLDKAQEVVDALQAGMSGGGGDSHLRRVLSSRRALESFFLERGTVRYGRQQLLDDAASASQKQAVHDTFDQLRCHFGVLDVTHLNNINIVVAAYGYTRLMKHRQFAGPNAVPVALQGFTESNGERMDKRYIYAMQAGTEGLRIKLSALAILTWCRDQMNWMVPDEALAGEVEAHQFLLANCPVLLESPREARTSRLGQPESAPLDLLHTISHALMATAKRYSGYSDNSLMEYLLPADLSVVIYVSSTQNYTAGGLKLMYTHHLAAWFDAAAGAGLSCIFDPICADKGASCSGCLQTVLSCETYNRGLSRSLLAGGILMPEEGLRLQVNDGFWSSVWASPPGNSAP